MGKFKIGDEVRIVKYAPTVSFSHFEKIVYAIGTKHVVSSLHTSGEAIINKCTTWYWSDLELELVK